MVEETLANIKKAINDNNKEKLELLLKELYPVDIAELIIELSLEETEFLFSILSLRKLAFVLAELDSDLRYELINLLKPEQIRIILNHMYADDIADLLGELSIGKSKELLNLMKQEDAQQIQSLLGYEEDSAGGIMTTEYIAIKQDKTVEEAISKIRKIATEAEMIYYIYIINNNRKLVGVLSMRELITAPPKKKLKNLMNQKVIDVKLDIDQEDVAGMISKYDLLAIPVVNSHEQLLGIITVDDIIDVIEEEATEDIYKMAATIDVDLDAKDNTLLSGIFKRLPWLTVLLFASMLSGSVIGKFSNALSSAVALAFFIPTLTGTGGNAGTQSLAIVVRGLATGDIEPKDVGKHLLNEIKVGLGVATICGLIIALVAFVWQGNYILGFIVGLSMFGTIVTATIVGTTTPFIISYFGADPAVAAGPFITTIIDVSGLFIYFSLAKFFLEKLI